MEKKYIRALVLSSEGKFKEAERLYQEGLKNALKTKNIDDIRVYYLYLGHFYLDIGNEKKSIKIFEEAVKILGGDPEFQLVYINALIWRLKDYDRALVKCEEVLKRLRGTTFTGLKILCKSLQFICYLNKGNYLLALRILKQIKRRRREKILLNGLNSQKIDRMEVLFNKFDTKRINKELLNLKDPILNEIFNIIKKSAKGTDYEDNINETINTLRKRS